MIGIAVLAFFLIALNIIFWIAFLKKFNKLFSTDDIISQARIEMTKMIEDVNRITSRNIDLIESKIKQLKAAAAEAERHISVVKSDFEKKVKLSEYESLLTKSFDSNLKNEKVFEGISDGLNSTKAYSITSRGKDALSLEQGDLFSQDDKSPYISSPTGTKFTIDREGNSFASIPTLGPNITYSDNPVKPKKTINQKIKELADKGYSVDLIASELNLTTSEVQFSLEMGL